MSKIMKRVKKIVMIMSYSALIFILTVWLFMKFWPTFGTAASSAKRAEYLERAANFDGKVFANENPLSVMHLIPNKPINKFLSKKGTTPKDEIPLAIPSFSETPRIDELTITWFGHSSVFLQMHSLNIFIDPMFSKYASPVSFTGSKRFSKLPLNIAELPAIDIVIYSHDHYDHLDYKTTLEIDKKVQKYIVPLGVENHLIHWGISPDKIITLAWWEEINIKGLTIACTPARHFSGRSLIDRFSTLWASWVLKDEYHSVYESGDSGYDTHYQKIREKYGDFDLVMLDCAQYNVRWPSVHQTPEEAFAAAKDLKTKYAMPIHWSTFKLSNHPWDDSPTRLVHASQKSNIPIITPLIGETVNYSKITEYQKRWYANIK